MNFISCSVPVTFDSSGSPVCSGEWQAFTQEQLANLISLSGSSSVMSLEMYQSLSYFAPLALLIAFGFRVSFKVIEEKTE